MNEICPSERCVGCGACANVCPRRCVDFALSPSEGFYRPTVDLSKCVDCNLCRKVCPGLVDERPSVSPNGEPEVYACWHNKKETRLASSSGGAFSALAEYALRKGGVVFGAAYDENYCVCHTCVESLERLDELRRSKYVQSRISIDTYRKVVEFLKQERTVLFVGTPCQVDALSRYVSVVAKDYRRFLITADLVCHGVPSPLLLEKHLTDLQNRYKSRIASINFRPKERGWGAQYVLLLLFQNNKKYSKSALSDLYIWAFLKNCGLQTACYLCRYVNTNRPGDLTVADFWGIGKDVPFEHDVRDGVSMVMTNSEIGRSVFAEIGDLVQYEKRSLAEAMKGLSKLSRPAEPHPRNAEFVEDFLRNGYWPQRLKKKYMPSLFVVYLKKFVDRIKRLVK